MEKTIALGDRRIRQLPFQRQVRSVAAVRHARAGGAGAERGQGRLAGGDRLRIERQAKVIIGAGEDNLLIADAPLGGGIDFVDAGAGTDSDRTFEIAHGHWRAAQTYHTVPWFFSR